MLEPTTYALTTVDNRWFGPNALPPIGDDITIEGHGATITRSGMETMRFFFVSRQVLTDGIAIVGGAARAHLTLHDLILSHDGSGGAFGRGGGHASSCGGGGGVGGGGGGAYDALDNGGSGGSSTGGGGAGMGGAVFNLDGKVDLVHSTLDGNTLEGPDSTGGALFTCDIGAYEGGSVVSIGDVTVVADATVEPDELFTVGLANPTGGWIGQATGTGTIENDDTATVTLTGVSQDEGTGAPTPFVFDATLSNPVQGGFTVAYTTNDGTATVAGGDYTDNDGSLTFSGTAGEIQPITVAVTGDTVYEDDETFSVALGAISGLAAGIDPMTLSTAGTPATGTILNDDKLIGSSLTAAKTLVSVGNSLPGDTVVYRIEVTNLGPAAQPDLPGDELLDPLPAELELVSATADKGSVLADTTGNTVTWNGALAANEKVVVMVTATIADGLAPDSLVSNQATVSFDTDENGAADSTRASDDPTVPGPSSATRFEVGAAEPMTEIPTLGPWGLTVLALLLAAAALRLVKP